MIEDRRSVLPPGLRSTLTKVCRHLHRSARGPGLHIVLKSLAQLPVQSIVRASREITNALLAVRSREIDFIPRWAFSNRCRRFRLWLLQPRKINRMALWFVCLPLRTQPTAFDTLKREPSSAWLLLFHWNGYVRAAALNAIQTPPTSPFFFAAIALRLNDWVKPVRLSAVLCATRVFSKTEPQVTANAILYLLDRRLVWARWNDEHAVLDTVFERPDVVEVIVSMISGSTTGSLVNALRHALRYPTIDPYLYQLALEAVQPAVRAVAFQCLIYHRASWPTGYAWQWIDKAYGKRKRVLAYADREISAPSKQDLIMTALRDRSVRVRHLAINALMADPKAVSNLDEVLARLAGDKNPAIRARADFMVQHLR